MSPATPRRAQEDNPQLDQNTIAICCWNSEGKQGCPDLKGPTVAEFKETFSGRAHEIAYRRGVDRSQRRKRYYTRGLRAGEEKDRVDYTVDELVENDIVTYEENGLETESVSLLDLFIETRPCGDNRDGYVCENPNYVSEAKMIDPVYLAPPGQLTQAQAQELCRTVQDARTAALKATTDLATAHLCPNNLKVVGRYCPKRIVHAKPKWDVSLAMWTGGNWVGGAIITLPVECQHPADPPPPESRNPLDPSPDPGGGGTPTPPGDPGPEGGTLHSWRAIEERRGSW